MCRSTNSLIFCWVSPPIGPSSGTAVLCWTRFRVFTRIVSMVILPSSSGYSPFSLPGRLTCGEFQESSRVFPTHHSLGVLDTRIPYLLFLSFFFLREDYGVPGRLLDFPCLLARPLDRRIVALPFFFLELTPRETAFALLWLIFLWPSVQFSRSRSVLQITHETSSSASFFLLPRLRIFLQCWFR